VYGLWHVKRILIKKEGRRYVLIPNKERFKTKEGPGTMRTSELDALLRETVDEIRTIPFNGELL
jgi:hypothetical protein